MINNVRIIYESDWVISEITTEHFGVLEYRCERFPINMNDGCCHVYGPDNEIEYTFKMLHNVLNNEQTVYSGGLFFGYDIGDLLESVSRHLAEKSLKTACFFIEKTKLKE